MGPTDAGPAGPPPEAGPQKRIPQVKDTGSTGQQPDRDNRRRWVVEVLRVVGPPLIRGVVSIVSEMIRRGGHLS